MTFLKNQQKWKVVLFRKQGMFWNLCFHVDNRIPSIFIKNWYTIFIKNARIVQYMSQKKSADFAESLFWELRYKQENKGLKTYLET